jgi:hypothetical protein
VAEWFVTMIIYCDQLPRLQIELVWVAAARGRLADPVTVAVLPALMVATFAISTLQPGNARAPAWDFLVGFGAMATIFCLLLLIVDRQQRRADDSRHAQAQPRSLAYGLALALLVLTLVVAGGTALNKHRELTELIPSSSSADIPKLPDGYQIIKTLTDCSSFCGGLVAIRGPDVPASQLENEVTRALLDNGWQADDMYPANNRPDFVKPVGGFLDWHYLLASIEIGDSPVAFPDINDPKLIVLGIGSWVPIVKP